MQQDLLDMLVARKGHFRLESGHHGDLWLDLDLLYLRVCRLRPSAAELARRVAAHDVDAVCGPLVGGAFLAQMIAEELDAEFYFAEQFVRPQGDGLYPLTYRLPDAVRSTVRGKRCAVVDDVINACSAVRGAYADVCACGGSVVAIGALLVLGAPASEFAANEKVALESLANWPNTVWEPAKCPLCASGVPLEAVAALS
jgi:orotate phosphoribosyltransferase